MTTNCIYLNETYYADENFTELYCSKYNTCTPGCSTTCPYYNAPALPTTAMDAMEDDMPF